VLAFVLAGGKGTRLHPLTAEHAKPALPFAGGYRIVDFVLSNLVNSGISQIYVLAQYKPQSLIEHLRATWILGSNPAGRPINVILPKAKLGPEGFRGTADAVYQNLDLLDRCQPDVVAVFAADHVYRMDVRQMEDMHRARRADLSIAAVSVPLERASGFGIIVTEADGRVVAFREKPLHPAAIPGKPGHAYASMGNYLFEPDVLVRALHEAHARGEHDFGHHVMPRMSCSARTYAYDFATNRVPGIEPGDERAYWRDIGTIEAYREAQRDVAGLRPRFRLSNPEWPIGCGMHARPEPEPAHV
jgi:glucose-1-phosphate adenylyltransferase